MRCSSDTRARQSPARGLPGKEHAWAHFTQFLVGGASEHWATPSSAPGDARRSSRPPSVSAGPQDGPSRHNRFSKGVSPEIRASFLARVQRLSWRSRLTAASRDANGSEYTSLTGRLLRVNEQSADPALCRATRIARSSVCPIYKEPSAHRRM